MLAERRVIPFIGAGLSLALGLPTWMTLLERIAGDLDVDGDFASIREACSGDPLQNEAHFEDHRLN
jgi:hypothetical protein